MAFCAPSRCVLMTGRHSGNAEDLQQRIHDVWAARKDRYSEERGQPGHDQAKVEMYRIGG